jgi:hypothetical protein
LLRLFPRAIGCAGVLFVLPLRRQQIVAAAAVLVHIVMAWRERVSEEAKAAREAAELEKYRARLRAERE